MGGPGSAWCYLSEHWPTVSVYLRVFTDDSWGRTIWTATGPVIYLRALLGPIAERCTLWHEIAHLELGPPTSDEDPVNELRACEWTARRLLPDVAQLGRILATNDVKATGRLLKVTRNVIYDRLRCLDEAERELFETVMARAGVAG